MHRVHRSLLALILLGLPLLSSCYLLTQGVYLVNYNLKSDDISTLLADGKLDPSTRELLIEVLSIKDFAVAELGLVANKNYTRYTELPREYLVDVVTAVEDDTLTPYTWRFPIVGEVPYKGFYRREDALALAQRLKRRNYDVIVRGVDAFSTLGFFSDPIYSFMDDYSTYELADLIIHEQTHATVFLKSQIQFNEELATFVGFEGALRYMEQRDGTVDALREKIKTAGSDRDTFLGLMRELYEDLDRLYASSLTREEKLAGKREIFSSFQFDVALHYDDYFTSDRFRFLQSMRLNNAYVVGWNIYSRDLSLFEKVYDQYDRDLHRFIEAVKGVKEWKGDPKEYLRQLL